MNSIFQPETFDFAARFLLAGFVIYAVRSFHVLGKRPRASDVLIESVILSLINQAVFLIIALGVDRFLGIDILFKSALSEQSLDRVIFFCETLLLPVVIGYAFGLNLKAGWRAAILRRLSMPVVHPSERAHDVAFGERQECFVIVTYDDYSQIHGYYGTNSLAASDDGPSDLYLEKIFEVMDDNQWQELNPPRSALISLKNVRSIEFIETEEDDA